MKKLLLSFVAIAVATIGMAQVSFYVDPPSANSGNYSLTFTDPAGGDWAGPDMTDPANAVTGTMVLVDDGNADPLLAREGCNPLTNGSTVSGNIAVVWRGSCQFGTKALNAQNEGAIAVIIVNHSGEPVGMAGGDDGPNVTIPVIMVSTNTGDLLLNEITAGTSTCFIGNKFGYFANDVGLGQKDVLRARQFATPSAFAQNDTEFSVNAGTWVFNFGQNDQTNVTVTCEVTGPGVTGTYMETSTPANILSGDSLFVSFPAFSQSTYPEEYYTMEYSVTSDATDDFPDDNSVNTDFMITEKEYAVSRIDATTKEPMAPQHFQPSSFSSSFNSCIHFVDPNASRRVAAGITFNATSASGTSLVGEIVNIEAYTWDDAVTDINDPNFGITVVNNITYGEHEYVNDDQDVNITTLFEEPFLMEDNVHYFFCISSTSQDIFLGYDGDLDYDENITADGHIVSIVGNDGSFSGLGFGTDVVTAITLNTEAPEWLGVEEDEAEENVALNAYPNPAVNEIIIPLGGLTGNAQLNIVDVTGKVISTQSVNLNTPQVNIDVTDIASGMYVFNLSLENGKMATFNVVVKK